MLKCWLVFKKAPAPHTKHLLRYGVPHRRHMAHKAIAALVCTVIGGAGIGAIVYPELVAPPAPTAELLEHRSDRPVNVPEPTALLILAGGLVTFVAMSWRRR